MSWTFANHSCHPAATHGRPLLGVQEHKERLGRVKSLLARMKLGKQPPPMKVTTPVASTDET